MKTKSTFLFFSLLGTGIFSQVTGQVKNNQTITPTSVEKCGFEQVHQEMMLTDPSYQQKTEQFNDFVRSFVPSKTAATYIIPVVVHVMDDGTSLTDITDTQIKGAIRGLNERMRKLAGGLGDGNGVDVLVEYALAVRDASGNCTDGIVRYDLSGNATYTQYGVKRSGATGITDATLKAASVWDQTKYYNMWLISEIDDNGGGTGIQGYAFFASSHGTASDGAVMLVNSFKNPEGTTLIHELGHSLNLYHTFQGDGTGSTCPTDAVCGTSGDCCADTPPHKRSSTDCLINTTDATCGNVDRDLYVHNYMDYSSDPCQNEFTDNQKTRMLAAVSVTRASFLAANGNMALVPVDPPTASLTVSNPVLCGTGQNVTLYDLSSCSPNTFMEETSWSGITYDWTVTNGTTTYTSTDQNPIITMNATGTYDVTLEITNAQGTDTYTETGAIIVSSSPAVGCTPTSPNQANYGHTVSNVSFNTIDITSSSLFNVAYTDNACTYNTVLDAGSSYNLSVKINAGGSGSEALEVYIDYNNDGVFTNPGELIMSGSTATNTSTTVSSSIAIPSSGITTNTLLRMRVLADAGTINANDRTCAANMFIPDVEDYGVYISTCSVPSIIGTTDNELINTTGSVALGATASAGTINWYAAASGGASLGSGTTFNTPSLSATTTYYVDATDGSCTTASRTAVIANVYNIKLDPSVCDLTLSDYSVAVTANSVPGATAYRFRIQNVTFGYQKYITEPTAQLPKDWVDDLWYNRNYRITVAAKKGGVWSDFGEACLVRTPNQTVKLQTAYCNRTLAVINQPMYCDKIAIATNYKYLVENVGLAYSQTFLRGSADTLFKITSLPGILYSTTYSVKVSYYYNGIWSPWGVSCDVTTPTEPKLEPADCNITLSAMNQLMHATTRSGVTNYRFLIENVGLGFSKLVTTGSSTNTFQFSAVSGILTSTTYTVKVAQYKGGVWSSYGSACNVTTAATAIIQHGGGDVVEVNGTSNVLEESYIDAFPNPNDGSFTLTSSHEGEFKVSNELGQVIQKIVVNKENNLKAAVHGLEKGIYFISGNLNGEMVITKIVVMK